jgi:hypothetical protein
MCHSIKIWINIKEIYLFLSLHLALTAEGDAAAFKVGVGEVAAISLPGGAFMLTKVRPVSLVPVIILELEIVGDGKGMHLKLLQQSFKTTGCSSDLHAATGNFGQRTFLQMASLLVVSVGVGLTWTSVTFIGMQLKVPQHSSKLIMRSLWLQGIWTIFGQVASVHFGFGVFEGSELALTHLKTPQHSLTSTLFKAGMHPTITGIAGHSTLAQGEWDDELLAGVRQVNVPQQSFKKIVSW